ncbi:MAG: hypothetical protein QM526_02575 [Alphaproteobacteria bacterium]|nr:hypothetical protein [Alphaproteobacteria bacterium]
MEKMPVYTKFEQRSEKNFDNIAAIFRRLQTVLNNINALKNNAYLKKQFLNILKLTPLLLAQACSNVNTNDELDKAPRVSYQTYINNDYGNVNTNDELDKAPRVSYQTYINNDYGNVIVKPPDYNKILTATSRITHPDGTVEENISQGAVGVTPPDINVQVIIKENGVTEACAIQALRLLDYPNITEVKFLKGLQLYCTTEIAKQLWEQYSTNRTYKHK